MYTSPQYKTTGLASLSANLYACRLSAEGLDPYWSSHLCQAHLLHHRHRGLDLDSVIQGIRESQRHRELWQRWACVFAAVPA